MMEELSWLYGAPSASGVIKQTPEDFVVLEDIGYEPDGEGEHILVRIQKTGCNTQFVAEALAKFVGVAARCVSYAGLKDRYAVTEQWFCLHLPGKTTPDMNRFQLDGCRVIAFSRHRRKLRIGNLRSNRFRLLIRDIDSRPLTESRLLKVSQGGVPNYFGEQRFGKNNNNLIQAERWAKGSIKVRERQKRSFYLSAVRSALFNKLTSARIFQGLVNQILVGDAVQLAGRGSWFVADAAELVQLRERLLAKELLITAPLPGDTALGSKEDALLFEQQQLDKYSDFMGLLRQERVESARRAMIVLPQQFNWQWLDDRTLALNFSLPAGSFATSVVRELINVIEK